MSGLSFFADKEGLPCLVTLEYMAQCIGVGAGLKARAKGEPPPPGMLIGSRELTLLYDVTPFGSTLKVIATETLCIGGFGQYSCEVLLGADLVSTGTISVARFDPDRSRESLINCPAAQIRIPFAARAR